MRTIYRRPFGSPKNQTNLVVSNSANNEPITMYKKLLFLVLISIFVANCTTPQNISLSEGDKVNMYKKSFIIITKDPKPFYAVIEKNKTTTNSSNVYNYAGGAGGYGIGRNAASASLDASAAIGNIFSPENKEKGAQIIKKYNIEDPAKFIRQSLKKNIEMKYDPITVDYGGFYTKKISTLSKHYKDFDFILDVGTNNWWISGFTKTYLTSYIQLELIDTKSKKVIAKGLCNSLGITSSPLHEESFKNNAKLLKSNLHIQSEACLEKFRNEILALK